MKPVVDGLKTQHAGKVDIQTLSTNAGDPAIESLASRFGVQYVPTFVFANADGTVSGTIVGEVPRASLDAAIAKLK
jgi:hypothetical protein